MQVKQERRHAQDYGSSACTTRMIQRSGRNGGAYESHDRDSPNFAYTAALS